MNRYQSVFEDEEYQALVSELSELEKDRKFCRHNISHFLDVARIMYILNFEHDFGMSKDIIYTAALLHDIGRVQQYRCGKPHNEAGAEIAGEILMRHSFDENEIQQICSAIISHRKKCKATGDEPLAALLFMADKLSRTCFDCDAQSDCYWDNNEKNKEIIW